MNKTNDFICNTQSQEVKSINLKRTMLACLVITGAFAVQAVVNITQWILWNVWTVIGFSNFLYHLTWNIAILIFFFTILFLYWSHKAFHQILAKGMNIIGILFLVVAFIVPRISDSVSVPSGMSFIRYHDFILADGVYINLGVICLLVGVLFLNGYRLQNEVDAIL